MRASSSTRRAFLLFASIFGLLFSPQLSGPAHAQQGHGLLLVENWPDEETRRTGRFEILPFVDTLSMAYRYREVERRPELSLVLEWKAAREAIYKGRRVSVEKIEGHPALVGLELSADVFSAGSRVAEFVLVVDSMIVEASPDIIRIDLPHLEWENVFVSTPADVARQIFSAGFELRNPTVISAGFALFDAGRQIADTAVKKRPAREGGRPPHVGPRRPRNVSIYRHPGFIDIGFDLFWLIGSGQRPVRIADDGPRENIGRGSLGGSRRSRSGRDDGAVDRRRGGSSSPKHIGAGEEDRPARGRRAGDAEGGREDTADAESGDESDRSDSGRSRSKFPGFGSGDDDDEDDEDDPNLAPYAIAAVAAAGVLAAVGGTIGYYGSTRYAPLGVTSGIVRDEGGILLQVGVNEALLAGDDGPKRLMGRVLSFGNLFRSSAIQPAFGVGVLATSDAGAIKYEPSVSIGGVARHNVLLFYVGYDVQNGPEFSLAFDLRQLWRKSR